MMTTMTPTDFHTESAKWDSGELGRDEAHVQVAPKFSATDDALGLRMIPIRLPKELIENFKLIGTMHGMGYQSLMRTTLQRFADGEFKMFGKDYMIKMIAQNKANQKSFELVRMAT